MIHGCPRCRTALLTESFKGVEIDRCKRCDGIWFDAGELAAAARVALPPITARGDSTRACPRCRDTMWHDRMGPILAERCRRCDGVFLDGGEFRTLRRGRTPIAGPRRWSFSWEDVNGRNRGSLGEAVVLMIGLSVLD